MPFWLVQDTTPGQFTFLVAVEVESAGHTTAVLTFGTHYEKPHQDEDDNGNSYCDDPFHGVLVAGGPGLVILPGLSGSNRRENHLTANPKPKIQVLC